MSIQNKKTHPFLDGFFAWVLFNRDQLQTDFRQVVSQILSFVFAQNAQGEGNQRPQVNRVVASLKMF